MNCPQVAPEVVIDLERRRHARQMNQRLGVNALVLAAAIKDARLNREDLKLLADLLHMRVLHGEMLRRYDPKNPAIVHPIRKLQRAGYLADAQVEDLVIGFRRNGDKTPISYWILSLTERELAREWQ